MAISGGLLIGWLPFAFTIAINVLEVGIAFIQAYIFTILTCVYLGDAFHLHGHDEHRALIGATRKCSKGFLFQLTREELEDYKQWIQQQQH